MKKLLLLAAGIAMLCGCAKSQEEEVTKSDTKPTFGVHLLFSFTKNNSSYSPVAEPGSTSWPTVPAGSYVMNVTCYLDSALSYDWRTELTLEGVYTLANGTQVFGNIPVTLTGSSWDSGYASFTGVVKSSATQLNLKNIKFTATDQTINNYEVIYLVEGVKVITKNDDTPPYTENRIQPSWNGNTWLLTAQYPVESELTIRQDTGDFYVWTFPKYAKQIDTKYSYVFIQISQLSPMWDSKYAYTYPDYAIYH